MREESSGRVVFPLFFFKLGEKSLDALGIDPDKVRRLDFSSKNGIPAFLFIPRKIEKLLSR